MISVACSTEQRHAHFDVGVCKPLSSPSALQASCPTASKPAPCAGSRAVTGSVGVQVPPFRRDPPGDAERLISADGVAGCERG